MMQAMAVMGAMVAQLSGHSGFDAQGENQETGGNGGLVAPLMAVLEAPLMVVLEAPLMVVLEAKVDMLVRQTEALAVMAA